MGEKKTEQTAAGGTAVGALAQAQPGDVGVLKLGVAETFSPRELAQLRVECLKVAVELRSAQRPPASYITTAREFEAYVVGAPEEAAAESPEAVKEQK